MIRNEKSGTKTFVAVFSLRPIVVTTIWATCLQGGASFYYTSSTAQGGGGSFKNRKPIGEVGCCESGMAERSD